MELFRYVLIGVFWVITCICLGLYINAIGFKGKKHHVFGLKTIFISYLIGIFMLFAAIVIF